MSLKKGVAMSETLGGKALEAALRSDDFASSGIELVGMLKAADEKGKISFSHTDCEGWIDIPSELIEGATQVGSSPCRDHTHPVFKITLRASDDPAAQVLSSLLAAQSAPPMHGHPERLMSEPSMRRRPAGPPNHSHDQMYAAMRLGGGVGVGIGPGGGLNAWGCFQSWCCSCGWHVDRYGNWNCCDEPCTRCIWPW
jgi:hypothetical protein